MAYLSLYRKYRPQTFDDILGQAHVSQTLANAIEEDRVTHAYLFTGPRGTGKTSTARILAKALNCEKGPTSRPCGQCPSCVAITEGSSLDVIELDAASHSSVDSTRDILSGVPLATAGGRKKVYVIDEVHMLTPQSFNALLKTLEEPPGHVVFVLATTEAHKVLPTIVSRTQRFDFRRVPVDVLEEHLAAVAKLENVDVTADALGVVARHADGSVRDALSVLDQIAGVEGRIDVDDVEQLLGGRRADAVSTVFDAIASHDVGGVLTTVEGLVAQGADMRQVTLGILQHARSLLLVKTAPDASGLLDVADHDVARLAGQTDAFSEAWLLRIMDLAAKAQTEMRNSPAHRLLLEVALIRATAPATDESAAGLLGRIERLERRIGIEGPPVQVAPTAAPSSRPADAPARSAPAPAPSPTATPSASDAPPEAVAATPASTAPDDAAAAPTAPSTAHIGLNHVRDAWPATLKEVSDRSKRVWGLLSPSRPVRFEDGSLVVEVQSVFHQETMSTRGHAEVLADALHAALGVSPQLAFEARGQNTGSSSPPKTSDAEPGEDLSELAHAAPIEKESDPIELVKQGLGAEVVEERTDS